jgi:hypothetical protein
MGTVLTALVLLVVLGAVVVAWMLEIGNQATRAMLAHLKDDYS